MCKFVGKFHCKGHPALGMAAGRSASSETPEGGVTSPVRVYTGTGTRSESRWPEMDKASAGAQESLIGKVGRVTVSIPASGPGEVLLPVRGGSEAFAALSDEPIARHTRIVVVEALSGRSVLVTPIQ